MMGFEWVSDPTAWLGLATLVALEIVLGIDNLVFIAILSDKLPPHQRKKARLIGLGLALFMRLALLASISWIVTLTEPLFTVLGVSVSGRDLILIVGGLFLLFKGTMELHERLEGAHGERKGNVVHAVFWQIIVQIVVLDIVFSLDSVITAVGMVREFSVMVIAVVIAVGVMMLASGPLMTFISRHPTVVILCLGFLLMIGFSLIVEGLGFHIPKGYLYAAIGFSILIEAANQLGRRNVAHRVASADLRDRTAQAVLRMLGGGAQTPGDAEEMAALAAAPGGNPLFGEQEREMIGRVLRLGDRSVRSLMTSRANAVWVDAGDPAEVILDEVRTSGHSRFPVARGDNDYIVGVVHAKDLLAQMRENGRIDLAAAMREPLYVTEAMPVLKLLERFKTSPVHMAVVLDEHGMFQGIATPTDILTAIAGAMPEGEDEAQAEAVQGDDGAWLLDGQMEIDAVERTLTVTGMMDEDHYTTLAGFLLHGFGHIPEPGEHLSWNGWRFEIVALDDRRIAKVLAKPETAAAAAQNAAS
jgi:CBS domain containing-hemolysin-like protein